MAWFKKRREVIDLTYLAKRGLIKLPKQEEYKDLSQSSSTPAADSSALGFLSAMASSSEASSPSAETSSDAGINKNKVEDIEYKLEIVSKRVNAMLDRLDLVEKKLSRDLRQGNS